MAFSLTNKQVESYHENGYLIIPGFINADEVAKLYRVAIEDEAIRKNSFDLDDKAGKKTKLALWFTPGNDVYGLLTRSERMIDSVHKLLDGKAPVCHFHSKLMQKEPKVGGAWEWHQDYGYWYKNGYLFPDQMISVMVAVTEATKENGCLQVIKKSHKMGRVEHGFSGEQVGASMQYVEFALQTMELVYVKLKPGDLLFFHSNILHRSEANLSDTARWSLISAYNRQTNPPYITETPSSITPLQTVPDDALLLHDDASGILENTTQFLSVESAKAKN
ncbi:phytanoyl-CoA dioxygenase family protein [Larkinella sp. GY13]|uniref:phytanoyl-CoA dioxygenase family protein n=1 Tax=Larkinella sp. GY13 TaxID=3453720 RepID=UPI003EE93671